MPATLLAIALACALIRPADAAPRRHPRTVCAPITIDGIPDLFCPTTSARR